MVVWSAHNDQLRAESALAGPFSASTIPSLSGGVGECGARSVERCAPHARLSRPNERPFPCCYPLPPCPAFGAYISVSGRCRKCLRSCPVLHDCSHKYKLSAPAGGVFSFTPLSIGRETALLLGRLTAERVVLLGAVLEQGAPSL